MTPPPRTDPPAAQQGLAPSSVGQLTSPDARAADHAASVAHAAMQATVERAVAHAVATHQWGPADKTHNEVEKLLLEIKSLKRAGITTVASILTTFAALIGVYLQSSVSESKKQLAALEVAQAKFSVDSLKRVEVSFAALQEQHRADIAAAQSTLSNLKAERDAVAASLDSAQVQIGRVAGYVGNLPDDAHRRDLERVVARLRTSVENAAGVTDVQRAAEDTASHAILATPSAASRPVPNTPSTAVGPIALMPTAAGPPSAPPSASAALAAFNVDVFYVRDVPGQRERATRVRDQLLATRALRDVRLKSAGPAYLRALGVSATEIRYDSDERTVAEALRTLLQGQADADGTTLKAIPTRTPSYLSLFLTPPEGRM